jgi:hypothetical protein
MLGWLVYEHAYVTKWTLAKEAARPVVVVAESPYGARDVAGKTGPAAPIVAQIGE